MSGKTRIVCKNSALVLTAPPSIYQHRRLTGRKFRARGKPWPRVATRSVSRRRPSTRLDLASSRMNAASDVIKRARGPRSNGVRSAQESLFFVLRARARRFPWRKSQVSATVESTVPLPEGGISFRSQSLFFLVTFFSNSSLRSLASLIKSGERCLRRSDRARLKGLFAVSFLRTWYDTEFPVGFFLSLRCASRRSFTG